MKKIRHFIHIPFRTTLVVIALAALLAALSYRAGDYYVTRFLPRNTANHFIDLVFAHQYDDAFSLCMRGMQEEVGDSPRGLAFLEHIDFQGTGWMYKTELYEEDRAYYNGVLKGVDSAGVESTYDMNIWLQFDKQIGAWRVGEFWINYQPQD